MTIYRVTIYSQSLHHNPSYTYPAEGPMPAIEHAVEMFAMEFASKGATVDGIECHIKSCGA